MPNRPLPPSRAGLTRRTAIATFAVGVGSVLAGCTNEPNPSDSRRRRGAGPAEERADRLDPDATVASMALANEQSALDAVEATAARHRDLAELLAPVIAAHGEHVRLLAEAAPATPAPSADPTAANGAAASPSSSPVAPGEQGARRHRVPREPHAALTSISATEQDLSTSMKRHAFVAQSGAFARLLASMAASAGQHAVLLGRPLPTKQADR